MMSTEIHPTPLSDAEYHAKSSAVIDIDAHRTGGLLELVFPNGSKIVLNTQPPLHEVWMAARAGGYHFKFVDGLWRDREGREFFELLSVCATQQGGKPLAFKAPN